MAKVITCDSCGSSVSKRKTKLIDHIGRVCLSCISEYKEAISRSNTSKEFKRIVESTVSLIKVTPSANLAEVGNNLKEAINYFLENNKLFSAKDRSETREYQHTVVDCAIANFEINKDKYLSQDIFELLPD